MNLPTKEAVDNYFSDHNNDCPFCRENSGIESISELVQEHNCIWQDMQCTSCQKIWRDEYRLKNISVAIVDENNQHGRWYSDKAVAVKDMYLHEYQDIINQHNEK